MREYKVKSGTFIKTCNNTKEMMYHLIISLVPIIIFAIIKNGIIPLLRGYGEISDFVNLIVIMILPSLICIFTEYFYYTLKKDKKNLLFLVNNSFSMVPGIFISLIIPLNTPIWLVVFASIIASFSKMLFGGLGKNKFNPALFGAIIVIFLSYIYMGEFGGYLNSYELEIFDVGTPLYNCKELSYVGTYTDSISVFGNMFNLFFGNVPGAIGTTSVCLCILSFIYLNIKKVIKWRIPVFCIGTVFVMSFIISILNGMGMWYPLFNILIGSVVFSSVFMATDPVTSPITEHSQILGGIILGILIILIRYLTNIYEGELISILLFNIVTIFLNKFSIKYNFNKKYKIFNVISVVIVAFIFCFVIANVL